MPYVGQKPADIISTAVDTVTGKFSGALDVKGAAVFNEDSADVDFRVESNGQANMLFVDGGNDRVGIGTNSPARTVQIVDSSATPYLSIVGPNGSGAGIMLGDTDDETVGRITYDNSVNNLQFWTNDAEQVRIHSNGVLSASDGIALGVGTANTASNVISDYEEGTFTATLTPDVSGSITLGNGLMRYTKVGRLVTVSGLIICSAISSPQGSPLIGGLPFTSDNNTNGVHSGYSTGSIHIQGLASDIGGVPQLNIPNNNTIIVIDGFTGTGNTAIADNLSASTQIRICATYTV